MAQQANNSQEPQTLDALVDFILRPTQEAEEEEDIWDWDREPDLRCSKADRSAAAGPMATSRSDRRSPDRRRSR